MLVLALVGDGAAGTGAKKRPRRGADHRPRGLRALYFVYRSAPDRAQRHARAIRRAPAPTPPFQVLASGCLITRIPALTNRRTNPPRPQKSIPFIIMSYPHLQAISYLVDLWLLICSEVAKKKKKRMRTDHEAA